MRPIRTFNVTPALPNRLEGLKGLAYNLQWDWDVDTVELFRRLDPDLWESSHYNPVLMLGMISQQRLQAAAEDEGFVAQADRALQRMEDYLRERTWYAKNRSQPVSGEGYAYFSMEFGLTSCMPVYSGGLGVLAGDHLKSASDLGLPLVGVGLLYQEGYFAQYFNADGWQQERYPVNDFYNMPLHQVRDAQGSEIQIAVDYPGRTVYARVWRVKVGTVPLYLLDTNIEPNNQYDQDICNRLYGGDTDMRIHQEIMLGIGGVRMLEALNIRPTAYHMNEGHSAFLALERIRMLMDDQALSFVEALQVATASQVFTTHTPVPAGIDLFGADKVLYYLGHYGRRFGLADDEFLALGREHIGELSTPFSMAVLAIKTATFVNGVSQLHGAVSREMFGGLWQDLPLNEVPITSITNGVHARSCVAKPTQELYDRYLGPSWSQVGSQNPLWERVKSIPDEELWRNHELCRSRLVMYVRNQLKKSLLDRDAPAHEIAKAEEVLDPAVLTIGFARRFATYKRATLFLRDLDRIRQIITGGNTHRKVQFVIAGKAHPKDIPGKELIRSIIHFTRDEGLDSSIVFIPNYDIHTARAMVAGADVWLNNPRRPREASGTSGMKAAMNGLLNLSVLDGWWDEADYVKTGWAIGSGEVYDDPEYQDEVEANALYELIEQEVVPLFYNRDENNVPRGWLAKMKDAIHLNIPTFNTARMVKEYARRAYFMASDRLQQLSASQYKPAQELAAWHSRLTEYWYDTKIEAIDIAAPTDLQVNQTFNVQARIDLGQLSADDILVEIYQGTVQVDGEIHGGNPIPMTYQGQDDSGKSTYRAMLQYTKSGLQGFSLRILPQHRYLHSSFDPRLILWAQPDDVQVSIGTPVPGTEPSVPTAMLH